MHAIKSLLNLGGIDTEENKRVSQKTNRILDENLIRIIECNKEVNKY